MTRPAASTDGDAPDRTTRRVHTPTARKSPRRRMKPPPVRQSCAGAPLKRRPYTARLDPENRMYKRNFALGGVGSQIHEILESTGYA
jgi:hypothetical protein